jgi:adenine-specific DNA glycosylase
MYKLLAALLLLASGAAIAADVTLSYDQAKSLADRDEAALIATASNALVASQRKLVDVAAAVCKPDAPGADLSPFVIVTELDATGTVEKTWRKGSSELAVCFEKTMTGKTLVSPPKGPFYTSFEMTFKP